VAALCQTAALDRTFVILLDSVKARIVFRATAGPDARYLTGQGMVNIKELAYRLLDCLRGDTADALRDSVPGPGDIGVAKKARTAGQH